MLHSCVIDCMLQNLIGGNFRHSKMLEFSVDWSNVVSLRSLKIVGEVWRIMTPVQYSRDHIRIKMTIICRHSSFSRFNYKKQAYNIRNFWNLVGKLIYVNHLLIETSINFTYIYIYIFMIIMLIIIINIRLLLFQLKN